MKALVTGLLALLTFSLYVFAVPAFALFGAKPELIFILIICTAVFAEEPFSPVAIGLFIGIALDSTLQPGTYINTAFYIIVAVLSVLAVKLIDMKSPPAVMLAVAAAGLLKYFLLIFVLYALDLASSPTLMIFVKGLPSVAYTVLVSLPCFFLFRQLYKPRFMRAGSEEAGWFIGQ